MTGLADHQRRYLDKIVDDSRGHPYFKPYMMSMLRRGKTTGYWIRIYEKKVLL